MGNSARDIAKRTKRKYKGVTISGRKVAIETGGAISLVGLKKKVKGVKTRVKTRIARVDKKKLRERIAKATETTRKGFAFVDTALQHASVEAAIKAEEKADREAVSVARYKIAPRGYPPREGGREETIIRTYDLSGKPELSERAVHYDADDTLRETPVTGKLQIISAPMDLLCPGCGAKYSRGRKIYKKRRRLICPSCGQDFGVVGSKWF